MQSDIGKIPDHKTGICDLGYEMKREFRREEFSHFGFWNGDWGFKDWSLHIADFGMRIGDSKIGVVDLNSDFCLLTCPEQYLTSRFS